MSFRLIKIFSWYHKKNDEIQHILVLLRKDALCLIIVYCPDRHSNSQTSTWKASNRRTSVSEVSLKRRVLKKSINSVNLSFLSLWNSKVNQTRFSQFFLEMTLKLGVTGIRRSLGPLDQRGKPTEIWTKANTKRIEIKHITWKTSYSRKGVRGRSKNVRVENSGGLSLP